MHIEWPFYFTVHVLITFCSRTFCKNEENSVRAGSQEAVQNCMECYVSLLDSHG